MVSQNTLACTLVLSSAFTVACSTGEEDTQLKQGLTGHLSDRVERLENVHSIVSEQTPKYISGFPASVPQGPILGLLDLKTNRGLSNAPQYLEDAKIFLETDFQTDCNIEAEEIFEWCKHSAIVSQASYNITRGLESIEPFGTAFKEASIDTAELKDLSTQDYNTCNQMIDAIKHQIEQLPSAPTQQLSR